MTDRNALQHDTNQFRYTTVDNGSASSTVTHLSVQRVITRHEPASRTLDKRSHLPQIVKVRDHLQNLAMKWLALLLRIQITGLATMAAGFHDFSQFLHARDGKNKDLMKFNPTDGYVQVLKTRPFIKFLKLQRKDQK
jgi:hypothetical protein